jgi:hypothetical protein
MHTETFYLAEIIKTPSAAEWGDAHANDTLVNHYWGEKGWFQAHNIVFVRKQDAWTNTDTGTTYPAKFYVYSNNRSAVYLLTAGAKRFLRCLRKDGRPIVSPGERAAKIAERIEWELSR